MLVNWTQDRIRVIPVLRNGIQAEKDLVLLPGINDVPDDTWALARIHIAQDLKDKTILEVKGEVEEVIDPETKNKTWKITSKTLKEIPAKEAEAIVKETFNLSTLNKWLTDDPRDSVRTEIRNQIDSVNKHGEDEAKRKADANK